MAGESREVRPPVTNAGPPSQEGAGAAASMGWSWRIGRIAGIDVYVHPTFLILLAWLGLVYYLERRDPMDALSGIIFTLALFGIVVVHELGHALMARRFGIRTRDITLLPIGGVSHLERIPEIPSQELLVALAGPAVNVVIAGGIYAGLLLMGLGVLPAGEALRGRGGFWQAMFWVNISLAAFNAIPAFPMDGGRVFRALLAMRLDHVTATRVAVGAGQVIAVLFGLLGLLANPLLIFIAVFVWLAGAQEAGLVVVRSALGGIPVRRVMITDFRSLRVDDPLSRDVADVLAGFQQDFPVVEDDRVVGILTRNGLAAALGRYGPETSVGEVLQRDSATADPREMLQTVFERIQAGQCRTLPVASDGRMVGLLTADNVAEVLLIQQTLREAGRPGMFGGRPGVAEGREQAGARARGIRVP
jgi:Zn-dependent protease/predicted transcriptional regulator